MLQLVRVVAPGVSGVLHMSKKVINFDTFVAGSASLLGPKLRPTSGLSIVHGFFDPAPSCFQEDLCFVVCSRLQGLPF